MPGWYREGSNTFLYRVAATVYSASTTTSDVTITVPPGLDAFWSTTTGIQSDGDDVRVVGADGTLLSYKASSFTYASRVLVLDIDNLSVTEGANQIFIYWGNSTVSSGAASFATGATLTGYVDLARPTGPTISLQPERPGDVRPRQQIAIASTDDRYFWVDMRPLLMGAFDKVNSHTLLEEASYVTYIVNDSATGPKTGMVNATKTRFVDGFVRVLIKGTGGTDGSDYTLIVTIVTTEGQTITARAWIKVRSVDEV